MADFRRSLTGHFGNRSDLIKLQRLIAQVRTIPAVATNDLPPRDLAALSGAIAEVTQLEFRERAFDELAVLRAFYGGGLSLSDRDADDLRRVFGECGTSAAERLGLPESATATELRATASRRHAYWSARSAEALSGPEHHAARVMQRSYDDLISHIGA
jgi:hypothetical protein